MSGELPRTSPTPTTPPPSDGAKEPWFKRGWAIVAMVLAAFVVGTQLGGVSETATPAAATSDVNPEAAATEEPVKDDEPDFDAIAADICADLGGPDDLGDALRAADVSNAEQRSLRLAVEQACPDEAVAPATPSYYEPSPDDYELSVTVLEKKCFGSAGCNVTFRVDLAYGGRAVDPDQRYELTYEVVGGDDPLIRTMELRGDTYMQREEDRIGTPSASSELTATVISVRARG